MPASLQCAEGFFLLCGNADGANHVFPGKFGQLTTVQAIRFGRWRYRPDDPARSSNHDRYARLLATSGKPEPGRTGLVDQHLNIHAEGNELLDQSIIIG